MNHKYPLALLALTAVASFPGHASANTNTADADCSGMSFSMPATEDGTTIVVTRNGVEEYRTRSDVFGTRYAFTIPSPDQTVTQVWRVTVSGFNGTSNWSETVAPCVAPTTSSTTTTSTTVVKPTTTTSVPNPSTTVSTTIPPTAPTTVVTTPRPTPTTSTVPFRLPDTGWTGTSLALAAWIVAVGIGARTLARRK